MQTFSGSFGLSCSILSDDNHDYDDGDNDNDKEDMSQNFLKIIFRLKHSGIASCCQFTECHVQIDVCVRSNATIISTFAIQSYGCYLFRLSRTGPLNNDNFDCQRFRLSHFSETIRVCLRLQPRSTHFAFTDIGHANLVSARRKLRCGISNTSVAQAQITGSLLHRRQCCEPERNTI